MEVEAKPKPRKSVLKGSVNAAVCNAFNNPKARESLVTATTQCFGADDRVQVESLLSGISNVLQQTVQAHVDNWTAERGLDQALEVVDEQCLRASSPFSSNENMSPLAQPSATLPKTSYAQVRLNCKKQQLNELKNDLDDRTSQVENLKAEVTQQIETTSALNQSVGNFAQDNTLTL